jgi:hypothetical protein
MISIDYCPDFRGGHSLEIKESREPMSRRFRSGGAMPEKTRAWLGKEGSRELELGRRDSSCCCSSSRFRARFASFYSFLLNLASALGFPLL